MVNAGNGSVVAGRNDQGATFRSVGMGPMFGDTGSATDLSEAGVKAVAEAYLGRGPATSLTELLCARSGVRSLVELLEGVARARIDPVPFAPTIIRAAEDGDAVAVALLASAVRTLGTTAAHVARQLHLEGVAFDLVLAGSMLGAKSPDAARRARRVRAHRRTRRPARPPGVPAGRRRSASRDRAHGSGRVLNDVAAQTDQQTRSEPILRVSTPDTMPRKHLDEHAG